MTIKERKRERGRWKERGRRELERERGGEEGLFTITGNNNLTIKKDSFPA